MIIKKRQRITNEKLLGHVIKEIEYFLWRQSMAYEMEKFWLNIPRPIKRTHLEMKHIIHMNKVRTWKVSYMSREYDKWIKKRKTKIPKFILPRESFLKVLYKSLKSSFKELLP